MTMVMRCIWIQGLTSNYKKAWWRFIFQLVKRWAVVPMKLWWGCALLTSGHHFTKYADEAIEHLDVELRTGVEESSATRVAVA